MPASAVAPVSAFIIRIMGCMLENYMHCAVENVLNFTARTVFGLLMFFKSFQRHNLLRGFTE